MRNVTLRRRTRPDKDKVTGLMAVTVIGRDHEALRKAGLMPLRRSVICIARLLDPSVEGQCWGRTTLDHIKTQPRMGRRAESDADHLVSLCQGHTEDGRRAGFQWNTAHRPELREYLASQSGVEGLQ